MKNNLNKENKKLHKIIATIAVIVIISITLFSCIINKPFTPFKPEIQNTQKNKESLEYANQAIELFKKHYLYSDKIDQDKLTIGMINGILSQDKYGRMEVGSHLLSFEETDSKLIGLRIKRTKYGKYFVLGDLSAEKKPIANLVSVDNDKNYDKSLFANEIKRGDEIVYFESEDKKYDVEGLQMQDYVNIISPTQEYKDKGYKPLPDKFFMAVKRLNSPYQNEYAKNYNILVFEIEKQKMNPSLFNESIKLNQNSYVLKLNSFSTLSTDLENLIIEVDRIKKDKKIKNLAIDLRDNPGGDISILALFVKIFYGNVNNFIELESKTKKTRYSVNELVNSIKTKEEYDKVKIKYPNTYNAINTNTTPLIKEREDINIYVFTNDKTASASEAFVGLTKNVKINKNYKGQIGQTTYGKGVAQTIFPFKGFNYLNTPTYIAITTSKYNILNSNNQYENINGKGYSPEDKFKIQITQENERVHEKIEDDIFYKKFIEATR